MTAGHDALEGAARWREVLLDTAARIAAAKRLVREADPAMEWFAADDEAALDRACDVLQRLSDELTATAIDEYDADNLP